MTSVQSCVRDGTALRGPPEKQLPARVAGRVAGACGHTARGGHCPACSRLLSCRASAGEAPGPGSVGEELAVAGLGQEVPATSWCSDLHTVLGGRGSDRLVPVQGLVFGVAVAQGFASKQILESRGSLGTSILS